MDLIRPLKQDLGEYRLAMGRPSWGPLFARRDGEPWRITDVNNWRRRVWHPARERAGVELLPPYDLRHAFASLQIRAGISLPELAEQMGHSPQMTLLTYTHVMRELKSQPAFLRSERRNVRHPCKQRQWRGPESNRRHHDFQS